MADAEHKVISHWSSLDLLHELASREGKFEVVQPSNEMAAPANTSAAFEVAFRKDLKIVRQRITSSQTTGRGASSRW
ncbi:MAG: hypothetical protein BRC34_01070 [Cyanobacteria bacterium QH_1_48_107]|nr:MAG: hypothetical protein BRC34_01070 [Cyanobacteria bacterium QH_1_48_107]PSP32687.1 MAG: hypothetical protein BRC57_14520 [Cyanobacteria bacterium QS_8_48_54]